MTNGEKKQEAPSARRRLIRGTFASPVVLALHSGSAMAAASSLNCVRAQLRSPVFPLAATGTDTYVRVRLYGKGGVGTPGEQFFLSGASLNALVNGYVINSFFNSGWREVTFNSNGAATVLPTILPSQPSGTDLRMKYVAIRFAPVAGDPSKVQIVGVVDGINEAGSTAVTGSCWGSFAPVVGPG